VICLTDNPAQVGDLIEATLVWMIDEPMIQGRSYLLKIGPKTVTAKVLSLKYKINVNTMEQSPAEKISLNEIGVCELELDRAVAFDPYAENRDTGGFILIDRLTNNTVGAGMLRRGSRRSQIADWQALEVNRQTRAGIKGQKPCVVSFAGISGETGREIAHLVERKLHSELRHTILLEDLGKLPVAEVAKLMLDAGLIVLVSGGDPTLLQTKFASSEYFAASAGTTETPLNAAERIVAELHRRAILEPDSEDFAI
jgi:bifunctional enzyme CysN/CysC